MGVGPSNSTRPLGKGAGEDGAKPTTNRAEKQSALVIVLRDFHKR
jgi:hypothetical protein